MGWWPWSATEGPASPWRARTSRACSPRAELEHHEIILDRRLVTEADMLGWMSEVLDVPECVSADEMAGKLRDKPRQAFTLRNLHKAWTRQVEGFEAISTLLYVLNATSDHHFWVASMHQLSWDFFASSGSLVDVGVFRTVVSLKPLTAGQLRTCVGCARSGAGVPPGHQQVAAFERLRRRPLGRPGAGINLFFRLLAEASQGNPSVAVQLWLKCLHPTEDPRLLLVHAGDALDTGVVPDCRTARCSRSWRFVSRTSSTKTSWRK